MEPIQTEQQTQAAQAKTCRYCGGPLSDDTVVCPMCGLSATGEFQTPAANRKITYQTHIQRNGKIIHSRKPIVIKLVILAVLLLAIFVCFFVASQSHVVSNSRLEREAKTHYAEYSQQLDSYLSEEDYMNFNIFWQQKKLSICDTNLYDKYYPVSRLTSTYAYLYNDIVSAAFPTEYDNRETAIQSIASDLELFYEYDLEHFSHYEAYNRPANVQAAARMEANLHNMLRTYCGLTDEDVNSLKDMSQNRIIILLEERIPNEHS